MLSRQMLRAFSAGLVAAVLIFGPAQSQAQSQDAARKTPPKPDFSSLMVVVDRGGFAKVNLWVPAKVDDPTKFRHALAQSLSFPITFDTPGEHSSPGASGDEEEMAAFAEVYEEQEWTFINARSVRPLSEGMKSTVRLAFNPLEDELRSIGFKKISFGMMFEDPNVEVSLAGATTRGSEYGQLSLNYYRLEIDLNKPATAVIEFSVGFDAADIMRRSIPLVAFMWSVVILTLWMRRRALRMREQPAEMWGRYVHFWQLLISLSWLVWIPICAWSGLDEVILVAVGTGRKLTAQVLNMVLYLLPPLFALCISQLLSKPIYDQMRGLEWSPREMMKKAIAANAVSLLPLFILLIVIGMFNSGSRFTGLVLIGATVAWMASLSLINRIFQASFQAVSAGELRDRIFELAEKAGVRVKQVYILPESASQPSNAFARSDNAVMITASLLKHLNKSEVDAIMAHEIGHLKEKHPQMKGYITVGAIVVTNLVGSSLAAIVGAKGSWAVTFSFAMLISILIMHFLARGHERHADAIGIGLTGDPESFISGLAKLCRLNLMPLNSGSWGESMESHPRTKNRLQDIARVHGISEPRFQELLDAPLATEGCYSTVNADEVSGKVFSSDFKKKVHTRRVLILLALLLLTPAVIALLLARVPLHGVAQLAAYLCGVVVTLGIALTAKNFVVSRGFGKAAHLLRSKFEQQGFVDAARQGVLVGLAPAAQTQKYENYLFWDAGVLWLTSDRLNYIGEETRFSISREKIANVYWREACPEWLGDRSLFVEWRGDENVIVTSAIHFLRIGGGTLLQERRELLSLYARIKGWLERSDTFPESSPQTQALPAPAFPEITSEAVSDKFNPGLIFKAMVTMGGVSAVLSFAFRLSFAAACYAIALLFLTMLVDELPKILNRNTAAKARVNDPTNGYAPAVWAESNSAATSPTLE